MKKSNLILDTTSMSHMVNDETDTAICILPVSVDGKVLLVETVGESEAEPCLALPSAPQPCENIDSLTCVRTVLESTIKAKAEFFTWHGIFDIPPYNKKDKLGFYIAWDCDFDDDFPGIKVIDFDELGHYIVSEGQLCNYTHAYLNRFMQMFFPFTLNDFAGKSAAYIHGALMAAGGHAVSKANSPYRNRVGGLESDWLQAGVDYIDRIQKTLD